MPLEDFVGKVILCTDGIERNILSVNEKWVSYEIYSALLGRWQSVGEVPREQVERSILDGQEVIYE